MGKSVYTLKTELIYPTQIEMIRYYIKEINFSKVILSPNLSSIIVRIQQAG